MIRIVLALALAAALLLSASLVSFAQTPPAQIVKERQDGMEKNWTDYYRDIAQTIKTNSPNLTLIATKAAGAVEHLKNLEQLFPPGTGHDVVPKSRTKPEVWTKRAEFDGAFKALIDETNALADAAKKGDVQKVKVEWQATAKACGGCHGGPKKSGGKFRIEEQ